MKKFIKLTSVILILALLIELLPMNVFATEASVDEITPTISSEFPPEASAPAEILFEDTSKREQYVKHFRMSDGTYRATQYEIPVHFMQNDEWVDYDNTLVEVDAADEENEGKIFKNKDLKNTFADYTVRLSKKTNGHKFVRVEKDGYKLSWYYLNAKKSTAEITEYSDDNDVTTLEKVASRVVYNNVYKNIDFEYIVSSTGVKENIIINEKGTQTVFEAEYKANGLTPVLIDDTTVELRDENNNAVYVISAPYMMDANGEISTDVTLAVSSIENNKFTVTTTVDEDWLSDEERQFPVTVDPVVKTTQEYGESESAFVASDKASTACSYQSRGGDSGSLYVGDIDEFGMTESYLKVNNLPTLGVADTVVNAKIALWLHMCGPGLRVDVHKITSDWAWNTVTWNTRPNKDPIILDYKMLENGDNNETIFFEITDTVRSWYSTEQTNYGIALTTEETASSKAWMYSSRISKTKYPGCRPVLYVDYRNMSGYEDYWSYTSVAAGRGGTVSVNNYNGNVIFSQPVTLDNGGSLMPVSLSIVYNTNGESATYTYMARNMQTNFHLYVRYSPETAENYYYYFFNDADGTKHYFKFEENCFTNGKDEDGLGYTFDVVKDNPDPLCTEAWFRITDKNKTKMFFNELGNVIQITDQNGVSAYVVYGDYNRIEYIQDGAKRKYTFKYNPDYPDLCTSIIDPARRTTDFYYAEGILFGIRFPDHKEVYLDYTSYELSHITAIDGTLAKIDYDFSSQRRATKLSWGKKCANSLELTPANTLEEYAFSYKQNETTVTYNQDSEYTYQFNNYAQTTGIVSNEDGRAQYFDYTPGSTNSPTANKLLSQSKVVSSVTNYIVDPGFTRLLGSSYWTYIPDTTGNPYVSQNNDGCLTQISLEVYKPNDNPGNVMAIQDVGEIGEGTYTFSGYVFSNGQLSSGNGVYLGVTINDSNGTYLREYSAGGIYATNGWERYSVTFKVENNERVQVVMGLAGLDSGGTVWFDDLQLEKGAGVSSCNLVENSDYENDYMRWESGTISNYANLNGFRRCLWIEGRTEPTNKWNTMLQYMYIDEGKEDDVFSFGAWVKANSAPLNNGTKKDDSCIPEYYLALHFYDSNGLWLQTEYVNINEDVSDWQFVSGAAVAKQDYSKIGIDLVYNHNVNYAYLTGAFCYREQFGQTYTYDNDGNVISSVDLTSSQSTFTHQDNRLASVLNPSGSEYIYSYNNDTGNLSYAASTDGVQYSFTYDDNGNPVSAKMSEKKLVKEITPNTEYIIKNKYSENVIDGYGEGSTTIVNYSDYENNAYQKWKFQSVGDEPGAYYIYNSYLGAWLTVVGTDNSNGARFGYETSGDGNRFRFKLIKNDDGSFTITTKTSTYEKCIDGMPGDTTDCSNDTPIYQYDIVDDDAGQHWYFFIPPASSKYISTSATYTATGDVSSETDQRGITTTYGYDDETNALKSVVVSNKYITLYKYDDNTNQLTSVQALSDPATVVMTNSYSYANDRLTSINVNGATRYNFSYDKYGRTTETGIGEGDNNITLSTVTYNDKGLVAKQTYGNGDYITYGYDDFDRLTEKSYNSVGVNKIQYNYNADGNLSQIIDEASNSHTKYVYDLSGRLVSTREYYGTSLTSNSLLSSVNYIYADETNYLTETNFTSPLGYNRYSYVYGDMSAGQMPDTVYTVSFNGDDRITYTYDSLGRLSTKTVNGLGNTYTYVDGVGDNTTTFIDSLATTVGTYSYTYDNVGNITSIKIGNTVIKSYEYDCLGQLVRENDAEANATYTYTYLNGNILSKTRYAYTLGALGQALETINWTYGDTVWKDKLTQWNGQSISYDEIGNPENIGNTSLEWLGRQLVSVDNGTQEIAYTYNADGQRISKVIKDKTTGDISTTEYYYVGSMLAGEKRDGMPIVYMYDNNGDIYGLLYYYTPFYFVKNAQNDVVAIVDSANNVKARYYYDAWGNLTGIEDNDGIGYINSIRYRSYYYDAETQWYYLNSRYYNPQMCRFINADTTDVLSVSPMGLTDKNLFAYCDNNPVVRADHSGEFWNYIIGGVVGAVVGGVSAAISGGDWKAIALGAGVGAVGGLLAASGVPAGFQIVAGGLLSGGNNLATQTLVEGKSLQEVDWIDVGIDTAIGAGTSALSYGVTRNASKAADKIICKGANKVVKGQQSLLSGSRYGKGAIKKGTAIMNSGIKQMNTVRGTSSVVGSTSGGFLTSVKSFFKRLFR